MAYWMDLPIGQQLRTGRELLHIAGCQRARAAVAAATTPICSLLLLQRCSGH
jgi:hypothetical protein